MTKFALLKIPANLPVLRCVAYSTSIKHTIVAWIESTKQLKKSEATAAHTPPTGSAYINKSEISS